jgi:hypothetical protein
MRSMASHRSGMGLGMSSTTTGMGAGTTCQDDRDLQVPTLSNG